jgi:hypothetical protein
MPNEQFYWISVGRKNRGLSFWISFSGLTFVAINFPCFLVSFRRPIFQWKTFFRYLWARHGIKRKGGFTKMAGTSLLCRGATHFVRKLGCSKVRKLGCSKVRKLGCSKVRKLGCSKVRKLGCSKVRKLGCSKVRKLGCSKVRELGCPKVKKLKKTSIV